MRFEHNAVVREAVTRNISIGGMFIVLPGDFPSIGTELKVRVRLPALKDDTELTVTVRWTHADGIGVQFGQLRAKEAWAINKLLAEPKQSG